MLSSTEQTIIHPNQVVSPEVEAQARKLSNKYDVVALVTGAAALLALAYSVQTILSPFVLLLIAYLILSPFREYRAVRKLLVAAMTLFGLWFFVTLSGLLIPFIIGGVLAYLFNPLVTMLHERRRMHRTWSSLIIVLLFCGLIVGLGWIFIPSLIDQTQAFIQKLSTYAKQHADNLDAPHLRHMLMSIGLPGPFADQLVTTQASPQIKRLLAAMPKMVFDLIAGLPKFLERTLNLIIVPIAAFYFLKDWPKMVKLIGELLPAKNPARRTEIVSNIDRILYSYVRGQATVATIVGILGAIAYYILGIPYAGLLGVILGISDLIPIVGMIFSVFIVELVIFLTMELNFGIIMGGFLVIVGLHFLEVYIIGPRIVGEGIGIPPIVMILALLIFGYFLGFIGMLIAVPATAVIILFIEEYRRNLLEAEPA